MRIKLIVDHMNAFSKEYREIADVFCKDGSDFQKKLRSFLDGVEPTWDDGHLALLKADGEIVGWARSERWSEDAVFTWDTLEAFVHPQHRNRGYASLAASALVSGPLYGSGNIAVFHPTMLLVARRAGTYAQLFARRTVERWERA
jgi:GNAT superfamily N-acetyltransferase